MTSQWIVLWPGEQELYYTDILVDFQIENTDSEVQCIIGEARKQPICVLFGRSGQLALLWKKTNIQEYRLVMVMFISIQKNNILLHYIFFKLFSIFSKPILCIHILIFPSILGLVCLNHNSWLTVAEGG